MLRFRSLLVACALALPCSALAAQDTVWDFTHGTPPGEWRGTGLSPAPTFTRDGLRIRSSRDGRLEHTFTPAHSAELVTIEYTSAARGELLFLFQNGGKVFQIPVQVEETATPKRVQPPVTNYKDWNPYTGGIGIAIPAGLDLTIRRITLSSVNPVETFVIGLRGLFIMDIARPYMINFLWGPRLVSTPAEYTSLFLTTPPKPPSVNMLLVGIAALTATGAGCMVWRGRWQKIKGFAIVACTVGGIWVLYDLRMGAEFFSYLRSDYLTYWSQPLQERIFRVRGGFNTYAELLKPLLQQDAEYAFAPANEEYVDFLRYITYPSLPVRPEAMGSGVTLVAVYNRPDALVDEQNRLVLDGGLRTPPGDVIAVYDADSFLFRIRR